MTIIFQIILLFIMIIAFISTFGVKETKFRNDLAAMFIASAVAFVVSELYL